MTERDTDLDFDFFDDDPEPSERFDEEGPPREPVQAGGGRPPRRPPVARPPVGLTPLLRLAGLIAFAILIIVLFVFWISSCQGASKKNSYKRYMDRVSVVAKDSEQIGRELNDALTTQGIKFGELNTRLSGLAEQEQQDVVAARQMSSPGPLESSSADAVLRFGPFM